MASNQDINKHREAGCAGITTDKKHYEDGNSFIKRTRRAATLTEVEYLVASISAIPEISSLGAEEGHLLILMSFLSHLQVTAEMIFQAAIPRPGWSKAGAAEIVSSEWVLGHAFSTDVAVKAVLDRLVEYSLVSSTPDGRYSINGDIREVVLNTLPPELHPFWRQQALQVACGAIPKKYLDPPNFPMREIIKPHIIHALNAVRECDGYESVPLGSIPSLVSALIEASRFSGLAWKRTMITEARKILCHSSNGYLQLLLFQREALLDRLSNIPAKDYSVDENSNTDRRAHAALGSAIIQETLNHFQSEELSLALTSIDQWSPMPGGTSTLEDITTFRIKILQGKILRCLGRFQEAIRSLRISEDLMRAHKRINFDEDAGDLFVELADTLQELGDFAHSEALLRTQLSQSITPASKVLLQLSLAECLFAQEKFAEAETYYAPLEKYGKMAKMARLRLCITAAKLCHVQSKLNDAFSWWTEALQTINKFPPTSGCATCVIYLSLCDVLRRQGHTALEHTSRAEMAKIQSLSSNAEAKYWIAGLQRWHEYISEQSS